MWNRLYYRDPRTGATGGAAADAFGRAQRLFSRGVRSSNPRVAGRLASRLRFRRSGGGGGGTPGAGTPPPAPPPAAPPGGGTP